MLKDENRGQLGVGVIKSKRKRGKEGFVGENEREMKRGNGDERK